jgi:hypothetical protein
MINGHVDERVHDSSRNRASRDGTTIAISAFANTPLASSNNKMMRIYTVIS